MRINVITEQRHEDTTIECKARNKNEIIKPIRHSVAEIDRSCELYSEIVNCVLHIPVSQISYRNAGNIYNHN